MAYSAHTSAASSVTTSLVHATVKAERLARRVIQAKYGGVRKQLARQAGVAQVQVREGGRACSEVRNASAVARGSRATAGAGTAQRRRR